MKKWGKKSELPTKLQYEELPEYKGRPMVTDTWTRVCDFTNRMAGNLWTYIRPKAVRVLNRLSDYRVIKRMDRLETELNQPFLNENTELAGYIKHIVRDEVKKTKRAKS